MKNKNVVWQDNDLKREDREKLLKQPGLLLWFTGLSGSGKSTVANAVANRLHKKGYLTYQLDGDNIRHGLNSDLDFSKKDREENIRRIGETAALFVDAGLIAFASFISPFKKDRDRIRELIPKKRFIEVFVKCDLEECERRDVKGLYQKARNDEIKDFTGISSPYESPKDPEIVISTDKLTVGECVNKVIEYLKKRHNIL